jgi:hypothetical protein
MTKKKQIVNIPDAKIKQTPKTNKEMEQEVKKRLAIINHEFTEGFKFIRKYPKSVTFFGSARFKSNNKHYKRAREIARRVSELGYAVVTGGGPGIMEAANRGACEAGENKCGPSIGINIKLPFEQILNPYVSESMNFQYFFSRKVILSFSAETYLYFPGGFGTMDEFFEIITLIQTKKIPRVPVVLVGKGYWQPLDNFIKKTLYEKHKTINQQDRNIYRITNNIDEVISIIKKSPMRRE